MTKLSPSSRVIHALDVDSLEKGLEIVGKVSPYVDGIKVSYTLLFQHGISSFEAICENTSLPVIADLKLADIPAIVKRLSEKVLEAGVDGVIVHGFCGRDVVEACVEEAERRKAMVFVVAELSNPGAVEYMKGMGERIAKMALEAGAYGVVAPATRPDSIARIRRVVGEELVIISPGIGVQGAEVGDAILAGADYEVVGRLIYQAPDPAEAAKKIAEAIKKRTSS